MSNETFLIVSYRANGASRDAPISRRLFEEKTKQLKVETGTDLRADCKVESTHVCSVRRLDSHQFEAVCKKPDKKSVVFSLDRLQPAVEDKNFFGEKEDINAHVVFQQHDFLFTNFGQIYLRQRGAAEWSLLKDKKYNRYYCMGSLNAGSKNVLLYRTRLWYIDDKSQMAFISRAEGGDFEVYEYKKTKDVLGNVAAFSIFRKRLYAVNKDGVVAVFSIQRPHTLEKAIQTKVKEIYTTVSVDDPDHFFLASAAKDPVTNKWTANLYLIGGFLKVRDKIEIDCNPGAHHGYKLTMNPIYQIKTFTLQKVELALALFHLKLYAVVAVFRGMRLGLVAQGGCPGATKDLSGLLPVDLKAGSFLVFGDSCLATILVKI